MRPAIERKRFSIKLAQLSLAAACVCGSALSTIASGTVSRVMLRPEVSRVHREELVARLRVISWWPARRQPTGTRFLPFVPVAASF
jgi:hypothetical protein